jgi:hypothetical protein
LKTEILYVTFGEKMENTRKNRKTRGKTEKNQRKIGILLKLNHTYTSLLQMNQVLAFTHEEILLEI